MNRWLVLGMAACAACSTTNDTAVTGSAAGELISDGAHSGGTPGFFLLPPMVAAPQPTEAFEARLRPRVVIDEVVPTTGAVVRPIIEYTMDDPPAGGDGSEIVRVDANGEHYLVNFHTDRFMLDPTRYYRIRVLVGPRELGFADVDLVASGRELRHVDQDHYIPLLDGRTLPIKFRIERYVLDGDHDDVFDFADVCPTFADPAQTDSDGDGVGDACECATVVCAAADDCHRPGTCDPATGACDAPLADDGTACVAPASPAAAASCVAGACQRAIAAIALAPASSAVAIGDSIALGALVTDSAGAAIDDATITYELSNPACGTIDGAGTFTATGAGVTTVTASGGGRSATTTLLVHDGSSTLVLTGAGLPGGLFVGPGDTGATGTAVAVLAPGQSVELTATFNTIAVPAVNTQGFFAWSSSDPGVATVSATGTVTAVGGGFATITGGAGGLRGHFMVVSAPPRSRATSCRGSGWGDPHLVSHDGLAFDLQAAGEFLLAARGTDVELHARLEQPPGVDDLSLISMLATRVDQHAVAMANEASPVGRIRIDGEPVEVPDGGVHFAGGGRIDRFSPDEVQVTLPGGEAVTATTSEAAGRPLSARVCRGAAQTTGWRGLLGNANGVTGDDLVGGDGVAYTPPLSLAGWRAFASSWRLGGGSALLHYAPGTSYLQYQWPDVPRTRRTAASLPAAARAWADLVCRTAGVSHPWLLDACTLDVGATGDASYAAQTAAIEAPAATVPVEVVCVPGPEVCDGADNDCDGAIDDLICCASTEVCDGVDQDEDGQVDEGVCCTATHEVCDGVDNDCNGGVDEACLCTQARPITGPHISLANGYKTINILPGADAWGYNGTRYGCGVSAGKWYWEVVYNARTYGVCVGVATDTVPAFADAHLSNVGPGGCYSPGGLFFPGYRGYSGSYGVGDVVSVLLDSDAGELRFWVNGVDRGRAPGTYAGLTLHPAIYLNQGCDQTTVNFGPHFQYAPPPGYLPLPGP
jgi:hypothetical protein